MEKIEFKSLLILGGTGFIGHHIASYAIKLNWKVTSISLNSPSKTRKVKGVNYIQLNLVDSQDTNSFFWDEYDYVINLAGYIGHGLFQSGGIDLIKQHFFLLLNVIQKLPRKKLKKFIQVGSSDEYGNNSSPQNEKVREDPISPYSLAKVSSTHFLQMLSKTEEFPSVIIRLFLTYGPGQNNRRFIPQVITGCLKGDNFSASLGEQKRDFLYIDDTVEAIFRLLNTNDIDGQIFNIASGNPIRIRDIVKKIKILVNNGTPNYGAIPYRKEENMLLYADISKLKKVINWSPKISLEDGLIKTISWYKNFI